MVSTTTLMTPELANFAGNVHGGHLLRLVDQIAYACAVSYSGEYCVTLSVDRVLFKVPVAVGDLVTMKAQVNRVGQTSLEVGVRVEARDLRGGPVRHTNSCFLTMVALRDGVPQPVPLLLPETEDDHRRNDQAKRRLEQTRLTDQVAANQVRYHDLIELSTAAALVTVAATGEIKRINQAACALLGVTREAVAQTPVWSLFKAEQELEAKRGYLAAAASGVRDFQIEHEVGGNGIRSLQVTAWSLPLPSGSLVQSIMRPAAR
jgi:PAS domain S-box-containing protein